MRTARPVVLISLLAVLSGAATLQAQEPLAAGSDGVPVPKKTRHVQPVYPAEALAQGIRGIVILDLVVGTDGKVESTSVIRSVPGLDEAAIAAARQWEYEPVRVNGKPVAVRITVPITFALALPKIARDSGIPELRQGATPAWPAGAPERGGAAEAEVTLESDGRIGVARITEGEEPWAGSLLAALRTWRFPPPSEDAVVSFRVRANFVGGGRAGQQRVDLKASGMHTADLLSAAQPGAAAAPSATTPAATPPAATTPPTAAAAAPATSSAAAPEAAPASTPTQLPSTTSPPPPAPPTASPAAAAPVPPAATPPAATAVAPTGAQPTPATPQAAATAETRPPLRSADSGGGVGAATGGAADRTAPPPVEVITAPPPAPPPENGISAIRDVTLSPGVPDLTRGRRPVSPPIARMNGTTGTVEVAFSVSAAGTTTVQHVAGPEDLRPAAQEAVTSWVFRRARADRAYLLAVFSYGEDQTTAEVHPQPEPSAPARPPAAMPAAAPGAAPPPGPGPVTSPPNAPPKT
jgi:TonB family protein